MSNENTIFDYDYDYEHEHDARRTTYGHAVEVSVARARDHRLLTLPAAPRKMTSQGKRAEARFPISCRGIVLT